VAGTTLSYTGGAFALLLALSTIISAWINMISFKQFGHWVDHCTQFFAGIVQLQHYVHAILHVVIDNAVTFTAVQPRIRSLADLCGINVGQNGTGIGFSLSTLAFPSQYHSTGALYTFIHSVYSLI